MTTPRTQVLVVLPDNGRARGLERVSLIDVVQRYGLYPTNGGEPPSEEQASG